MKSTIRSLLILTLLIASLPYGVAADAIRGRVVAIEEISAASSDSAPFHLEELVALELSTGADFVTGVELEISIPRELARLRNSFAVYLYRRVDPAPEADMVRRYFATSLDYYLVPSGRKMYIQIPLRSSADLPSTPETLTVDQVLSPADFPLLLSIQPVMKGIPSSIYEAEFRLKAYPYLADEGVLELAIQAPSDDPYSIVIDGSRREYRESGYLLESGIHEITIESTAFLPLTRSVTVTKGARSEVRLTLQKREPRVNFEAPEGTLIFLDGERVNGTSLKVNEGVHTVVFKLGDYSMTREFEVSGGKSYTITLFLDVFVKEN